MLQKKSEHMSKKQKAGALKPGLDYYWENGKMVLTAHFLRKRGYCCGNKCRHCPYGHVNVPPGRKPG